jgi:hypothetical protein
MVTTTDVTKIWGKVKNGWIAEDTEKRKEESPD